MILKSPYLHDELNQQILRTLLYYDIFSHPLTSHEIFLFLSQNSMSRFDLEKFLHSERKTVFVQSCGGKFFLSNRNKSIVERRRKNERRAQKRWLVAKIFTHLIKRFPFVRGVYVSGDLAKNIAHRGSDIDYVIITSPRRLWICRTLLILFKKIFLFNRKKYFCLNYLVTSDHLEAEEKNYFTATEIAHLKPLFNFPLFLDYLNANYWIKRYLPNYFLFLNQTHICGSRPSILQKLFEIPSSGKWADTFDAWLMNRMIQVWKLRYPHLTDNERDFRFRCTPTESRAFGQESGSKILALYHEKLSQFDLEPPALYG